MRVVQVVSVTAALPSVAVRYYPASGSAQAHSALLSATDAPDSLLLHIAGETQPVAFAASALQVSEHFAHASRSIRLADGAVLEVDDGAQLSRVLAAVGKPDAVVTRWQQNWPMVVASLLLSIVAVIAAYVWVLPVVADHVAARVPSAWTEALDNLVIGQLQRQGSLESTTLTPADQQRLRARFAASIASTPRPADAATVTVHFFRMGNTPNAFALPGGSIVFLDGLVKMAPDDDALVGVFAHEYGHVLHRHGLRTLLRTAAVSAVAAWYFGDFTSLANAAVIVSQLSYSRGFETQADDTAIEVMRANKLGTQSLAELFRRMRDRSGTHAHGSEASATEPTTTKGEAKPPVEATGKSSGQRIGPFTIPEFLSTHPDIERRIERFDRVPSR